MNDIQHVWPGWELVEKIGEGAYGKVYKIRYNDDGFVKYSALKIIEFPQSEAEVQELLNTGMDYPSVKSYYEDIRKNLIGEIRVMESLKTGANIVVIEDYKYVEHAESVGWTIYIRMELLQSLNQYLQEVKELTQKEVIKLGKDICQALECCEQNHIIHRDIKPDNIFRNQYGSYKLGDFGIAKQMEMTKSVYSQKGTSMYMAPEVYRGESYHQTVDIYSLGIMLYRLLNHGRFPFMPPYPAQIRPGDAETAMKKRFNGDVMKAPDKADIQIAFIIAKAIAYKPADRYEHASDMREALEKAEYELYYRNKTVTDHDSQTENKAEYELPGQEDKTAVISQKKEEAADGINNEAAVPTGDEATYVSWKKEKLPVFDLKEENEKESREERKEEPQKASSKSPEIVFHWVDEDKEEIEELKRKAELEEKKHQRKKLIAVGIIMAFLISVIVGNYMSEQRKLKKEEDFQTAEDYVENGDYGAAARAYEQCISDYPADDNGYIGLATVYENQGEYDKALEIISDGLWECESISDLSELKDEIETSKQEAENNALYDGKIQEAADCKENGDYEKAKEAYLAAADINPSRTEAWTGLVETDIQAGNYDGAIETLTDKSAELFVLDAESYTELMSRSMRGKYTPKLQEIQTMMENEDYGGLLNFFANERDYFDSISNDFLGGDSSDFNVYFQNGELVGKIESGTGLIVSSWGAYMGEISENERTGSGRQFGIYSDSAETKCYTLTDGQWKNNKANGQCTFKKIYIDKPSSNYIYTGNVTDNLFDGDITIQWVYDDGREDSGVAHAEKGTFSVIRQTEEGYFVIAESVSGGYTYQKDEDSLKGRGVWDNY